MLFPTAAALALAIGAVGSSASIIGTENIPLIGPSFLSNVDLSKSKYINDAKKEFAERLEKAFSSGVLNSTDLVFGLDVYSANTNASIFSHFHTGQGQEPALTAGVLDDGTIGRMGSVSKLFTAYALVAHSGLEVFSHPVTRYFPELACNGSDARLDRIRWEEITVGALASHQAGTGGVADFSGANTSFENLTLETFIPFIRDVKRPVMPAYRNALYSDAGYTLLGHVLGRITGKGYAQSVQDILFTPLGLNSTTVSPPNGSDVNAVDRRPLDNTTSFGLDWPLTQPSGGLYSSLADMRTLGLSILNSDVLSPSTTRSWMKPLSATGSLVDLVGAPWEINRLTIPATPGSNMTRVSDLYTKAGGNGDYTAIFALSPDHGLGFSLVIAGRTASSARWPLRQIAAEVFIPAAESAAAENAQDNLAGVFADEAGNNMTISFTEGKPGLGLDSLFYQGAESRYFLGGLPTPRDTSMRLYPTGPSLASPSLSELYRTGGTLLVSHRIVWDLAPPDPRAAALGGAGLFDNQFEWQNVGFNGELDELVFNVTDGRLVSVEVRATESLGGVLVMKRVE